MATRFYIESTGSAAFDTLAFSAYWDSVTGTHYHYPSSTTKGGSANAARAVAWATGKIAAVQLVSEQRGAFNFTTAQTLKFQIRANSDSGDGVYLAVSIRVVSSDGGTVRGTLYEGAGPTVIPSASNSNRSLGADGAAVNLQNDVSMSNGDRIICEIGQSSTGATGSSYFCGSDSASDLPENETSTDAYNGWFEFSGTVPAYSTSSNIVLNVV